MSAERAVAFVDHARRYSALGWALVPAEGKRPKGRGWERTEPEPAELAAGKWSRWGETLNMGLVCGGSGSAILDVDVDVDPEGALLALLRTGTLPRTPIVRTGGGRLQVHYLDPGGLEKAVDEQGIELRVGPHFCVLPPSVHPDTGRAYLYLIGHEPWNVPRLPLPEIVVEHFAALQHRNGVPAAPIGDVIPIGEIDTTLASIAGTMRRRGVSENAIFAALVEELARCESGHTHTENDCRRIAKSVARYAPDEQVRPGLDAGWTHPASGTEDDGKGAGASVRPYVVGTQGRDAPSSSSVRGDSEGASGSSLEVEEAEAFAAVDEASAEPILGDEENTVMAAGGSGVYYGDGGAGKTTLGLDRACHYCAGRDWLGLVVPRPLRVLWIENEGPRGKFRKKLRKKLAMWDGPSLEGRLHVLSAPWARFTFADKEMRAQLVEIIRRLEIDVVIAGPVARLGAEGGGTPKEIQAFIDVLELVRADLERPLAYELIHHENKAGGVSGAWEGATDTLVHVQARGNGHTAIVWRKARWADEIHQTTWKLDWTAGERFERDETPETTDEDIAETLLGLVREAPGRSWNGYDKDLGGNAARKRAIRDELLEAGRLVNTGTAKAMTLYLREQAPALDQTTLEDV